MACKNCNKTPQPEKTVDGKFTYYSGSTTTTLGIKSGDTLDEVVKKIDDYLASFTPPTTTTSTTSTSTTSSTTSTTTTVASVTISWDVFATDPGDPEDATLTKSLTINHKADYTIDTEDVSGYNYFVIEEPSTETIKTKWYSTQLNNGVIPDQVWNIPTVVGGFRYYKTRTQQAFDPASGVKLEK